MGVGHRRMMEFEDKAKVVAFDWGGGKVCSIPCRAGCFAWVYLEEQDKFNHFFDLSSNPSFFYGVGWGPQSTNITLYVYVEYWTDKDKF